LEDYKGKTTAPLGRLEESGEGARKLRERDHAALEAAGFEQVEAGLWAKEGVCYGREAALQKTRLNWPEWY
jgi:hypothetical protein